jgi:hypothetical protein
MEEAKIPSIIYYDSAGKARAFGAHARSVEMKDQAYAEQWTLAQDFKLHLHPNAMKVDHPITLKPLPRGVPIQQIYTDWMGYLFRHTEAYFQSTIVAGETVWRRHRSSIQFVFAHPNGWEISQQSLLRKAAIAAGLVTSSSAGELIRFVGEAEASVHFIMLHSDLEGRLEVVLFSPTFLFMLNHLSCSLVPTS